MRIALVARTDLDYEGSVVPAGTRFEATPIAAAVLRYQRLAEFAPPGYTDPRPQTAPVAVAPAPDPEPAPPVRRRGRPRKVAQDAPDPAPAETPRRRTYQRRNLTAEPT